MKPIRFPWPDSGLSPNRRGDRRSLTGKRRTAREVGWLLIKEAGLRLPETDLELSLKICPPNRLRRDLDNIYASFKSYQDGIFMALGLDDTLIRRVILLRGEVEKGGSIYVMLQEMEQI